MPIQPEMRQTFLNKLIDRCLNFADLSQSEQYVIFSPISLIWLGKFIPPNDKPVLEAVFERYTDTMFFLDIP